MTSDDVGSKNRAFVSLGMFIIDEFSFADEDGKPTGRTLAPQVSSSRYFDKSLDADREYCTRVQIGGGGTYASIGARIWSVRSTNPKVATELFQATAVSSRNDHRQRPRLSSPYTGRLGCIRGRHVALPRSP